MAYSEAGFFIMEDVASSSSTFSTTAGKVATTPTSAMTSLPAINCTLEVAMYEMYNNSYFTLYDMSDECKATLSRYSLLWRIVIGLILSLIACGTCFGNMLVITAVSLVKKLRNPSNLLIVSLASSDLLVSILVLPLSIVKLLIGYFPFGEIVCDFWISCDVLLCTSSILNLCAISIDRYLVITKPFEYAVKRTPARMGLMIAGVWLLSAFISIPPMFGAKNEFVPGVCEYSDSLAYQIYATFGAFYLPLIIMLFLYGNIFKLARKMAKADEKQKVTQVKHDDKNLIDEQLPNGKNARPSMQSSGSDMPKRSARQATRKKSNSDSKAIKTLGVIMGCFTLCWLPFFIMQIVTPIYKVIRGYKLDINPNIIEFFLWLGYMNSFLNPIIYAKFNRDFRTPFKHILLCHCKSINERMRAEQFAEQYGLTSNRKSVASAGGRHRRRSSDVNARRARHNMNGAEHEV